MTQLATRIQRAARETARARYESVPVPPFTLFFHASDAARFFNYAIPDDDAGSQADALAASLGRLAREFEARGRAPRFELVEEAAPRVPRALLAAGYAEEYRAALMTCAPDELAPPPRVDGLALARLAPSSPLARALEAVDAQREAFGGGGRRPREDEAASLLSSSARDGVFLARVGGEAAGAASFTAPALGVVEIVGVATRPAYRGRGIAGALVRAAAAAAFAEGAELAYLATANAEAGRVYARAGFRTRLTALAFARA